MRKYDKRGFASAMFGNPIWDFGNRKWDPYVVHSILYQCISRITSFVSLPVDERNLHRRRYVYAFGIHMGSKVVCESISGAKKRYVESIGLICNLHGDSLAAARRHGTVSAGKSSEPVPGDTVLWRYR